MQYEEIRRQVLGAIRRAQARGLIHGTSGNIAVRQPGGDVVAITPSGRPYDTMQPEDIAIVTLSGEWIDGPYRPSSETPMHTAVYRARPDVGATVHTHALYSTVMAMGLDELPPSTPPQAEFAPMRVVPLRGARLPEAGGLCDRGPWGRMGWRCCCATHGNFCCGRDISAAMTAAVYVEEAAQVAYHATLLGQFRPLATEERAGLQGHAGSGQGRVTEQKAGRAAGVATLPQTVPQLHHTQIWIAAAHVSNQLHLRLCVLIGMAMGPPGPACQGVPWFHGSISAAPSEVDVWPAFVILPAGVADAIFFCVLHHVPVGGNKVPVGGNKNLS